jgi:hypothetical protein
MNRLIDRMKIFFLVVFGIACVAVWTLHLVWIWPGQRCEAKGWWWDWRKRICALPVPLEVLTGHKPGEVEKIIPQPQKVLPRPPQ